MQSFEACYSIPMHHYRVYHALWSANNIIVNRWLIYLSLFRFATDHQDDMWYVISLFRATDASFNLQLICHLALLSMLYRPSRMIFRLELPSIALAGRVQLIFLDKMFTKNSQKHYHRSSKSASVHYVSLDPVLSWSSRVRLVFSTYISSINTSFIILIFFLSSKTFLL